MGDNTAGYAAANRGTAIGHRNLSHTVHYTKLSPSRFRIFLVTKRLQGLAR